jgi:hypothetical protein
MPARWMQSKVTKQKRMRRAYLKKRSSSWGISPKEVLIVHEIFQNSSRVRSASGEPGKALPTPKHSLYNKKEYWVCGNCSARHAGDRVRCTCNELRPTPMFDNTFMHKIPNTKPVTDVVMIRDPRFQAEIRAYEIAQSDRRITFEEMIKGPLLVDFKGIQINLYFSGGRFCLVERDTTGPKRRTAYYKDRALLFKAYDMDMLTWYPAFEKPAG